MMRTRYPVSVALALASIALAGCGPPTLSPQEQSLLESIQTKPCDSEPFRDFADQTVLRVQAADTARAAVSDPSDQLVSARELNNSQVHDCQRLIERESSGQELAHGPLVALLVSPARTRRPMTDGGHVVADIVNYDTTGFATLGIPPGYSCLWIGRNPSAPTGLSAGVIPADPRGCAQTDGDGDPSIHLEVHALSADDGTTDFPETGRWMWDAAGQQQFIGIRCGDRWCEIGPAGFAGTDYIATADQAPGRTDRQLLAVGSSSGGTLAVSGLIGFIVPGEDNGVAEDPPPNPPGRDLHVATMDFLGSDTAAWMTYARKFSLDPGGPWTGHKVFMHPADNNKPGDLMKRFRNARMRNRWVEVRRCNVAHSGSGTVRWAWSEDDEGFWVPCDAGCCKVRTF